MNTFTQEKAKKGFQSVNSFLIEWDIVVNKVKRLPLIAEPEGDGANAGDIKFYFSENYYQKEDTFVIEKTRQHFIVVNTPQRLRDNCWLVVAKINDNDYSSTIDKLGGSLVGATTRWITNIKPELHETGYVKAQSNVEKARTYISTHRVDVDMSAKYAGMEDVFIKIGKGNESTDHVYKMNPAEKDCLDNFMEARNNSLTWGKSNVSADGKPKINHRSFYAVMYS